MKKLLAVIGLVMAGLLFVWNTGSAHTPNVSTSCDGLAINLTQYESARGYDSYNNIVEVWINGNQVRTSPFNGSHSDLIPWPSDGDEFSYKVKIDANLTRGHSTYYDKKITGTFSSDCTPDEPVCTANLFEGYEERGGLWEITYGMQHTDTNGVSTFTNDSYGGLVSFNGGEIPSYMGEPGTGYRWLYVYGDTPGKTYTWDFADGTVVTATVSYSDDGCPIVDWTTTDPPPEYCDPSQKPGGTSIDEWVPNDVNCLSFEVVPDCGVLLGVVRSDIEAPWGDGYALAWSEGSPDYTNFDQVLPAGWPEDYNGGSVEIFYWIIGPEAGYVQGHDLPNYWDENAASIVIDTDCEDPPVDTTPITDPPVETTDPPVETTDPPVDTTTPSTDPPVVTTTVPPVVTTTTVVPVTPTTQPPQPPAPGPTFDPFGPNTGSDFLLPMLFIGGMLLLAGGGIMISHHNLIPATVTRLRSLRRNR